MVDPDGESAIIPIGALATILAKAIVVTATVAVVTLAISGIGYVVSNIADSVSSSKNTIKSPTNINTPTTTTTTDTSRRKIYNPTILQANKHIEPPSKLKDGELVKTPSSHPNEFTKNKNRSGYTHNKTGWQAKPDPSNHGGPHWDMNPPRGSGNINVGPNGNIFGGSR